MIEPELGLFEVQIKRGIGDSVELCQSGLGKGPEGFDAVDVPLTVDELIGTAVDPVMLLIARIDQTIITSPTIGVDNATRVHFAPYNGLKRGLSTVWNDLRIDLATPLKNAEDRRFRSRPSSSFSFNPLLTVFLFRPVRMAILEAAMSITKCLIN